MNTSSASSRRSFLKGSALLATPLAAAGVSAVAFADDGLKARVSQLEDQAAIRQLHQLWVRQVNAGEADGQLAAVRRIDLHPQAAPERIEIAADGQTAVGHFDHAVEVETPLEPDSTLAQMAHVQGSGGVRQTQRRVLTVRYAKSAGAWRIVRVESRSL